MREIGYDGLETLGRALGNAARVKLLRLVAEAGALSAGELAAALGLSGGAVTGHIRALKEAGLVQVDNVNGVHGVRRMVSLTDRRLTLCLEAQREQEEGYAVELPVGSYAAHEVEPTCGLATSEGLLGQIDDPRYFDDPRHFSAGVLWMMAGQVTYRIPNYIPWGRRLRSVSIAQEISSEAPGTCGDWPSRIEFWLCDVCVGSWVSPGDYGDRRGLYNPPWWSDSLNQYGLRKTLTVNEAGSFMDGERISGVTVEDLPVQPGQPLCYQLRVSSGQKGGGLTLFGKGFGNYGQDIAVRVDYAGA